MDFEKKNNIYRVTMIILFTAFVTFVLTTYGIINYYIKSDNGKAEILSNNINISDQNVEIQKRLELVKSYIDKHYLGEIDETAMQEKAIKGYIEGLGDPYTEYLTAEEYKELMVDVNGNYVGIRSIYVAR